MPTAPIPLCQVDNATFWPWVTWADFARLPAKDRTLVVVPIVGFADWGLGHPLDAEESVLMPVLAGASRQRDPAVPLLVLPPLRFVAGPGAGCAFTVEVPAALAFIDEVCASIQAAGFRKIVLFNASPWNEELVDAAARDVRIARGLQMFCVNLSALDLDFRPGRSRSRRKLQTLLTALLGRAPDAIAVAIDGQPPLPLAEAAQEGTAVLAAAAAHLASLFGEIHARPPLPRDGALRAMTPP